MKERIGIVTDNIFIMGGVQKVISILSDELLKYYDITIWSLEKEDAMPYYDFNPKINFEYVSSKKLRIREMILITRKKIKKRVGEYKCLIAMGTIPGFILSMAMVGIKIPVIFSDHGALCNQLEDRKITLMRFLAAKLSKKIVALTNKTEKDYNRYFRIKKEKITTIYNPIETKFLTRKVKYTPSKKIIITVTRFGKEKGIDLLFNIAEKVLRKDKNIIWKVYGDGDLYKHYVSLATIKGIEKQLQLKGELKKIEEIYDEASLYALTSYREGLPVVLLEALGKNLPMISFDIETGPSEIISNEKNGILIPKYDIDLYADKILELLNNPLKLIKMSEDCEVKKSKFNLQEIAQKWYKVIETT